MDKAERKKLNLKAIKRYDPAIVNILDQSPHSVLYNFSQEKREWVKKSIEGVLFLVQRNAPPYFAVYIMNRLAMENYTLYLTDFEDMELQQNFIMYSTKGGERYAFWLYEENDRKRLLNKITRLHDGIQKELSAKTQTNTQNNTQINTQSTSQPSTQSDQQTSGSGNAAVDLLTMLKNATPRHHPPNEYGPEQIEQKHQQQHPFHHPSPAMLPPFQETHMNQWMPPPPPSISDHHTPEFALPKAELMMPQSHHQHPPPSEQPNGNRLLELLQKSVVNNDSQQQQQQQQQNIPSPGPPPHQLQSVPPPPPPEWNNGNRLLELLKKASIDDQKNMQHMPSPPPPIHPGANMLFGTPPQQHPHLPHPPPSLSSSSSTPNTMAVPPPPPHPLFGKELTKPYTPMPMGDNNNNNNNNGTSRNSNQSQGRNSALLLQALQGGMLNVPSPTINNNNSSNGNINNDDGNNNNNNLNVNGVNGQYEFSTNSSVVTLHGSPGPALPSSSRSSFSNVTPLMPQQTLALAQQEINKRLGGNQQQQQQQSQQRFLSKPEFIQQFLNIIQNDSTFFDTLYEDYKTQKTNGVANN